MFSKFQEPVICQFVFFNCSYWIVTFLTNYMKLRKIMRSIWKITWIRTQEHVLKLDFINGKCDNFLEVVFGNREQNFWQHKGSLVKKCATGF